jgi:excisionase family DNA binding protein
VSDDNFLYSVKEAARRLGISRSLAYELVESGELPSVRIHSKILIRSEDLAMYIQSLEYHGPAVYTGHKP